MFRNVREYGRERACPQRFMAGDRDMVLTVILGRQPHVTVGLPGNFIAKFFRSFAASRPLRSRGNLTRS